VKFHTAILVIGIALFLSVAVRSQLPTAPDKLDPIKSIKLDQNLLTLPCPHGEEACGGEPSKSLRINVQVEPYKSDKKISYKYFPTGGKIIGEGTRIGWDLSNTAPGSYWILVDAMRNGRLISESRSETINIIKAICICDCIRCPLIQINVTERTITAGETVSASATISDGSQAGPLTLSWTTSVGEIVSGQATNAILIRIPSDATSTNLTVTLTIGGLDRTCVCPTSQSATIKIRPATER
jgi:hypothetical protein